MGKVRVQEGQRKKTASRKRNKQSKKFAGIPEEQLRLPAGFTTDGKKLVTLEDMLSRKQVTLDFVQLTPEQRADLTAARIGRQRNYKMGMVGAGVIDKKRAIAEVKAQSEVGRVLMEIEQRTIRMLKEKKKAKAKER